MDLGRWLLELLTREAGAVLLVFALLTVRWLVFLLVAPFPVLGEMGGLLRAALAAALAAGTLPAALPVPAGLGDGGLLIPLLVKEALVGFALGAVTACFLAAFEAAGRLADLWRGATMADVLVGLGEGGSSPLGAFFALAALAILAASGGFLALVGALVRSAEAFPVHEFPARFLQPEAFVSGALALFARAWEVGFLLAAPVMAVSLLIDLSLGLAARVSPGFEGYFLALPARAVLGLGAVVAGLALLRPQVTELLRATLGFFGS